MELLDVFNTKYNTVTIHSGTILFKSSSDEAHVVKKQPFKMSGFADIRPRMHRKTIVMGKTMCDKKFTDMTGVYDLNPHTRDIHLHLSGEDIVASHTKSAKSVMTLDAGTIDTMLDVAKVVHSLRASYGSKLGGVLVNRCSRDISYVSTGATTAYTILCDIHNLPCIFLHDPIEVIHVFHNSSRIGENIDSYCKANGFFLKAVFDGVPRFSASHNLPVIMQALK